MLANRLWVMLWHAFVFPQFKTTYTTTTTTVVNTETSEEIDIRWLKRGHKLGLTEVENR